MSRNKRVSRVLSFEEAVAVHGMIADGEIQSRIAAHFDVNGGRISEVNTGKLHPGSCHIAASKRAA